MHKWFKLIWVADYHERAAGVIARVLGIDISILLVGYISDWVLIDFRIPHNNGIYLQIWFFIFNIGRFKNDTIYISKGE
jgi:hypothetical protein